MLSDKIECKTCKEVKAPTEFYRTTSRYLRGSCKACDNRRRLDNKRKAKLRKGTKNGVPQDLAGAGSQWRKYYEQHVEYIPASTECHKCPKEHFCRLRVAKGKWVMCELPDASDKLWAAVVKDLPEWPIVRPYETPST